MCELWFTLLRVPEIVQSATFRKWLSKLADREARARILARIDRLAMGNPGDVKAVGQGIGEMRIDYGPGYRVYLAQRDALVTVLLSGGDKRTQNADIKRAVAILDDWPTSTSTSRAPSAGDKKRPSVQKSRKRAPK